MRKFLAIIFGLAAFPLAVEKAAAMDSMPYVSQTDLKKKCGDNGGTFNSSSDGGYSCGKKCSNSGGYCVYGCGPNKDGQIECRGTSPERRLPQNQKWWTAEQVLTNGMGIAGGPPSPGPLGTGPGATPGSPSGVGTPRPTAPPAGKLY